MPLLLTAYDEQLRGEAEVRTAAQWDKSGPLWRAVHGDNHGFVTYEDLTDVDLERLVAETVTYFAEQQAVVAFEWKTRGHDDLPTLDAVLRAAGFVPDEVETVMVGDASVLAAHVSVPDGVTVRRIDDASDSARLLAEATALQREVFGGHGPDLAELVEQSDGVTEVWAAEVDGALVSCGRLEVVAGTTFAGLWGGATRVSWRGRGLYRAMTAARARSAMKRGVTMLNSDCTAMSRPILERAGLVAVTTTTPYFWTRG